MDNLAYGISLFYALIITGGSAWLYTKSIPIPGYIYTVPGSVVRNVKKLPVSIKKLFYAIKFLFGTIFHRLCMVHCVAAIFNGNKHTLGITKYGSTLYIGMAMV